MPTQKEVYRELLKIGGLGVLRFEDLPKLSDQRKRVFLYLIDGRWHPGPQIVQVAGGSEGLRRLRELREIPWLTIVRRRSDIDHRIFEYRMRVVRPPIREQIDSVPHGT